MKIEDIDIQATIEKAQAVVREDKQMSAATKSMFEILILVITLLVNRLGLNSTNSSKPPSTDPNRKRQTREKTGRKPGGQMGHVGTTLQKVENPDRVEEIKVDRRKLPAGQYRQVGFETRQVFDIDISRIVTEYRAQVLENENGCQFVASFPKGVDKAVQYGNGIKAHSVYMSQFQLVPYNRIQDHFSDQIQVPVSEGSIFNFNKEAYHLLGDFENRAKSKLVEADLAHADETGINIGGKRHWLHGLSDDLWTLYYPHEKRGTDAMDEMGVLPGFKGILCHDHWKPYYTYNCTHALCNAHHLRELTRVWEQDGQKWALEMKTFLETINQKVTDAGGALDAGESQKQRRKYRALIKKAEIECPEPERPKKKGKRGRIKKTKPRNLLERLRDFENDVLRFMDIDYVPFSNNLAENDIRMTKVQQKISGCFRSIEGAKIFCRVRSYLSTCRKHGISSTEALRSLFDGKLSDALLQ
ncbi:MAG: IS66 family transposase [Desulfobacterales bacterium]|nr:IS66 family transposase [Desulfobacterales bacterium]MDD3949984.1 IS66 family transposase [Desulfobacterales bacterium]